MKNIAFSFLAILMFWLQSCGLAFGNAIRVDLSTSKNPACEVAVEAYGGDITFLIELDKGQEKLFSPEPDVVKKFSCGQEPEDVSILNIPADTEVVFPDGISCPVRLGDRHLNISHDAKGCVYP